MASHANDLAIIKSVRTPKGVGNFVVIMELSSLQGFIALLALAFAALVGFYLGGGFEFRACHRSKPHYAQRQT